MHAVSFAAQCLHFAYDVSKYAQLLLSDSVFPLPVAVVDSLCDQFIPKVQAGVCLCLSISLQSKMWAAFCHIFEYYMICMASALAIVLSCGSVWHLIQIFNSKFLTATCFETYASEQSKLQILRDCQGWLATACISLKIGVLYLSCRQLLKQACEVQTGLKK